MAAKKKLTPAQKGAKTRKNNAKIAADNAKMVEDTAKITELGKVTERFEGAEKTHSDIRKFAFGEAPKDMELPVAIGEGRSRSFRTDWSEPDANNDAARVPLSDILAMKKSGVETGDPEAIVRKAWNVPPRPASASGELLGEYQTNRETAVTPKDRANVVESSMSLVKSHKNMPVDTSTSEVFESIIKERKSHFVAGSAGSDWYLGEKSGETGGIPQFSEGSSPQKIRTSANRFGLDEPSLRRSVALSSPRSTWSEEKKGETKYPNLEVATTAMVLGKTTDKSPMSIAESLVKGGTTYGGKALPNRVALTVQQQRGELSSPTERTAAAEGKTAPSQKVANFDLNLVNATSPKYGFSPWVAGEQSRGFTTDTHDLKVAGLKGPMSQKTASGKVKKFGDTFLSSAGGYDIAAATARVASADSFSEQFNKVKSSGGQGAAEEWARSNAHTYTPSAFQSTTWTTVRGKE